MNKHSFLSTRIALLALVSVLAACNPPDAPKEPEAPPPRPAGSYHVYVTNERSNDLTIIDSVTNDVAATVPLGKRPRGIHASPDGKTIYVALSGSPIAGPGVDESTLPPADKSADGIGVFDVNTRKLLKVVAGGSDPEEFSSEQRWHAAVHLQRRHWRNQYHRHRSGEGCGDPQSGR